MNIKVVLAVFCCLFMSIVSCASGPDYGKINRQLRTDNCAAAVEAVEDREKRYGRNQRLLYLMDAAMVNMLCENYSEANEYFHAAEVLAENLWTKSVSREAASFLWNDYTRPYAGEDFERVMINLLSAISYIEMGRMDEALVECRRLNSLLSMYNEKYDKKNVYKEDAFSRYLSGILYENAGDVDEAFIDYLRAFETYDDYARQYNTPMPPVVVEDLCRIAAFAGRTDEVEAAGCGEGNTASMTGKAYESLGRVVFIQFRGRVPGKVEERLLVATPDGPVTIAFPRYARINSEPGESTVIMESDQVRIPVRMHLVEDISRIAEKNLDDRKLRVTARAVSRALAKQVVFHQVAREAESDLVKLGLNFLNIFIERADTRSWRTLPGEIHLARAFVPPGNYRAYSGKRPVKKVKIEAGETQFVFWSTNPGA